MFLKKSTFCFRQVNIPALLLSTRTSAMVLLRHFRLVTKQPHPSSFQLLFWIGFFLMISVVFIAVFKLALSQVFRKYNLHQVIFKGFKFFFMGWESLFHRREPGVKKKRAWKFSSETGKTCLFVIYLYYVINCDLWWYLI